VINKSGAWYSFGEIRLGQGRENVRQYLKEQPQVYRQIEAKIKESWLPGKDQVDDTRDHAVELNQVLKEYF